MTHGIAGSNVQVHERVGGDCRHEGHHAQLDGPQSRSTRNALLERQAQEVGHDGDEALSITQQIVGFAFGHGMRETGFGGGALGGATSEEGGPLTELRGNSGQEHPHTAHSAAGSRPSSGRQH